MEVIVNGDLVTIAAQPLDEALKSLGYECRKVVVAVNETFVPRTDWSTHKLQSNDRIEVLSAIQGG